jgi:hypothetical protein
MNSLAIRTLVVVIALCTAAEAQPVITTTSGSWLHKATVTVTGSGFGSKSTAGPIVWDDASGTDILEKWDGAWPSNNPAYNTNYRLPQRGIGLPHSRITKYIAGAHGDDFGADAGYNVIFFKTRTVAYPAYTYASWYQRADDAWVFAPASNGNNNFKTFAYSIGTTPYELPNNWYLAYNTPLPDSRTSGASYVFGDDSNGLTLQFPDVNGHLQWWDEAANPMAGAWTKVEVEIKYTDQNDGYVKLWEDGRLLVDYVGRTDRLPGTMRTEGIGGYASQQNQPNNWRYFADVYLDYSRARVIVGNAPTFAASTIREVQIPASWSDSSISFSVNLGKFADGAPAYLYVVDANGSVNAVGTPINAGPGPEEPDTTAPSVSIDSPPMNALLSGVVMLSAAASDDTAVAGVEFRVDGMAVGAEDTAEPFSTAWDSASVANGTHVLTAVARDPAGNRGVSLEVTVAVKNVVPVPVPAGPVVAYGLDWRDAAVAPDSSGHNYAGTVSGSVQVVKGRHGNAFKFDGHSFITIPDRPTFDLTQGMTLEAWVNPSALWGWRTVLLKETSGGLAYALYANDNAPNPAVTVNTGARDQSASGSSGLPLNAWTHLAATYDGSTLQLFVNGVLANSRPLSGALLTSDGALRIGGNSVWGEYFEGLIDDVRVYDRALTAAEIQADMMTAVERASSQDAALLSQSYSSKGKAIVDKQTFTINDPAGPHALRVVSRDVTTAVITLNGRVIVGPGSVLQGAAAGQVSTIEIPIDVRAGSNELVTAFVARRGASLTVEIVGTAAPPPPPAITITSPTSGGLVTEGATVEIKVAATGVAPVNRVDLSVNGEPFSSDESAPFTFLLTVPKGVSFLTLRVGALDNNGATGASDDVTVGIAPDPLTTVTGKVVTTSGKAQAGADVQLSVNGLLAEVYHFDTPLSKLPRLKGLTPNQTMFVSAANLRNPAGLFGADPFGFGPTSHVVRLSGYLRTTVAGPYTFRLGANEGGRLVVWGVPLVDLPRGDGTFQQGTETLQLPKGWIHIEVLTFDNGYPEIQLSYDSPGKTWEVIPPAVLVPERTPYSARTGSTGTFAITGFPAALGDLTASATFTPPKGRAVEATAGPLAPVAGGTTDVGTLRLR